MTIKEFSFRIAQVENIIKQCRRKFKSQKHQDCYDNLIQLFQAIKLKYKSFTNPDDLEWCRDNVLFLVYTGIEFLDYKTQRDKPRRHIICLEKALHDWLDSPNLFSIVFSHNNLLDSFYTYSLDEKEINAFNIQCQRLIGVTYKHGLIHISQSRFFKDDFLSSIPIYHELGHFVEANYSITGYVLTDKTFSIAGVTSDQLPFYISEHFADLFAAQYLGDTMIDILKLHGEAGAGDEHPSTQARISIIYTFLSGSGSAEDKDLINRLKDATKNQTKNKQTERNLQIRKTPLSKDPFKINKSVKLKNRDELHQLYSMGLHYFLNSPEFEGIYPDEGKKIC